MDKNSLFKVCQYPTDMAGVKNFKNQNENELEKDIVIDISSLTKIIVTELEKQFLLKYENMVQETEDEFNLYCEDEEERQNEILKFQEKKACRLEDLRENIQEKNQKQYMTQIIKKVTEISSIFQPSHIIFLIPDSELDRFHYRLNYQPKANKPPEHNKFYLYFKRFFKDIAGHFSNKFVCQLMQTPYMKFDLFNNCQCAAQLAYMSEVGYTCICWDQTPMIYMPRGKIIIICQKKDIKIYDFEAKQQSMPSNNYRFRMERGELMISNTQKILPSYKKSQITYYIMWAQLHFVKGYQDNYTSYCLLENVGTDFILPPNYHQDLLNERNRLLELLNRDRRKVVEEKPAVNPMMNEPLNEETQIKYSSDIDSFY